MADIAHAHATQARMFCLRALALSSVLLCACGGAKSEPPASPKVAVVEVPAPVPSATPAIAAPPPTQPPPPQPEVESKSAPSMLELIGGEEMTARLKKAQARMGRIKV